MEKTKEDISASPISPSFLAYDEAFIDSPSFRASLQRHEDDLEDFGRWFEMLVRAMRTFLEDCTSMQKYMNGEICYYSRLECCDSLGRLGGQIVVESPVLSRSLLFFEFSTLPTQMLKSLERPSKLSMDRLQ